jgi:non-histone protein 10
MPSNTANNTQTSTSSTIHTKPTDEAGYRKKCLELKARIRELEASNNQLVVSIERKRRSVHRAKLEQSILKGYIEQTSQEHESDSEAEQPNPSST